MGFGVDAGLLGHVFTQVRRETGKE
jgi:hypothetical protein